MKKILCLSLVILLGFTSVVFAKTVHVRGSATKSGTYRQPHNKTSPNKTKFDNWSTKGNVNPYTGKKGTADPYRK